AGVRRVGPSLERRDRIMFAIDGGDDPYGDWQLDVGVRRRRHRRCPRRNVRIVDRQPGGLRLRHHPLQRDVAQASVAVAAADVRMDAAKPHFTRAAQPDRQERWSAFVQGHGVEAVVDVLLRDLERVPEVQRGVAEVGEPERRDDVPEAEEPDRRIRLDDLIGVWLADALLLDSATKIERRRRAAAKPDDVNQTVAAAGRRPVLAQAYVRLVETWTLTQAEHAAERAADHVPARADASDVILFLAGRLPVRRM